MYQKILVPVDGSETSLLGLREAIRIAKSQHSALRLLHVVHDFLVAGGHGAAMYTSQLRKDLRDRGEQILKEAAGIAHWQGIEAETRMVETPGGSVGTMIVEEAGNWPADLMVLGTHGRRGIRRLVMGSDAEYVVRMASVPVLLVREPEPAKREAESAKREAEPAKKD
jgi:nucleotide-binding universal stress UspA family protein